jgi:hypothetical protein
MSQTVRYPGRAFLKVLQDHARGQAASDLDPQAVVAGSTLVILACSKTAPRPISAEVHAPRPIQALWGSTLSVHWQAGRS